MPGRLSANGYRAGLWGLPDHLVNLTLLKGFSLGGVREGMKLEYRAEAFNAFNHPVFCGPNTTVGSSNFGKVFSQCQAPREIQMALKLYW